MIKIIFTQWWHSLIKQDNNKLSYLYISKTQKNLNIIMFDGKYYGSVYADNGCTDRVL